MRHPAERKSSHDLKLDAALLEDIDFEDIVRAKLKIFLRRAEGAHLRNLHEDVLAYVERPLVALVLEQTGGNQLKAAAMLGLNRNTLRKKMAKLGLAEPKNGSTRRAR